MLSLLPLFNFWNCKLPFLCKVTLLAFAPAVQQSWRELLLLHLILFNAQCCSPYSLRIALETSLWSFSAQFHRHFVLRDKNLRLLLFALNIYQVRFFQWIYFCLLLDSFSRLIYVISWLFWERNGLEQFYADMDSIRIIL